MDKAPIEAIYADTVELKDELEIVARAYHSAITNLKYDRMNNSERVLRSLQHLEKDIDTLDALQKRADRLYETARKRVNEIKIFGRN